MSETNDFAAWSNEFDNKFSTYISDDFIDLAAILAQDITNAKPEHREEKSQLAIRILEGQYADEMSMRDLTVVALRAMTMERIVLDNVLDKSEELIPVIARGTAFGCVYLRIASRGLEPVFGLQLAEPVILTPDHVPIAQIEAPLLIPLQDLRLRKLN